MGDHHEGLAGSAAETVQQSFHIVPMVLVQALQEFVQDIQGRILDKGAGDQAQALLPAGEPEERESGLSSNGPIENRSMSPCRFRSAATGSGLSAAAPCKASPTEGGSPSSVNRFQRCCMKKLRSP